MKKFLSALAICLAMVTFTIACSCKDQKGSGSSSESSSFSEVSDKDSASDSEWEDLTDGTITGAGDVTVGTGALYNTIGISQSEFDNEVKYPVRQDDFDYILFAEDRGVTGNDSKDDTVALQECIDWAASKNASESKLIILPQGNVFVSEGFNPKTHEYGLVIDGIDNLTIMGASSSSRTNLYFNSTPNEFTGIFVSECENLKFAHINIDWATLPFSMGTVTSCDTANRQITVRVDDNYPVDASFQVIEYLEFNKTSGLPRTNGNFAYIHNANKLISSVEYLGDQTIKITFNMSITNAPVGTRTVLAHSMTMGETVFAHGCKNLFFEHVYLYASKGMAIRIHTSDNLYFNHFRAICKPGTDRLMTSTADILHLKNCAGEIVITNSQFENSHDDAINIAGHFLRVKQIYKDGSVRLISQLGIGETFAPKVGDVYEVNNVDTLELLMTKTIKTVQLDADGYIVTFEEGSDGLELENAFANASRVPKLVFRNNVIRNKRNRGILVQTRNVTIENNVFSNILDGAIMMMVEMNDFHESISPQNVIIRNNKFADNSARAEADVIAVAYGRGMSIGNAGVLHDILVDNNYFGYSKNACVSLKGVGDAWVTNNYFYKPANAYVSGASNTAIALTNVKGLTIANNKVVEGSDTQFKSIFVNTGVDMNTVTITGNEGIDINHILGSPDPITIGKNGASINVADKSLADWAGVGTSMEIIGGTDMNLNELYEFNTSDFSAIVKVTYSDAGLYFCYEVIDEDLNFLEESSYLGDCVEIYLTTDVDSYEETTTLRMDNNATLQLRARTEAMGGMQIVAERTSPWVLEHADGIVLNTWTTENGYSGEGFIPFTSMEGLADIAAANGKISFSVNLFDNDKNDVMKYYSTTRHPVPTSMRTPAYMNKLILG